MLTYGKISNLYLRSVRFRLEHQPSRLRLSVSQGQYLD